jgi:ABC-type protease/lipase transport system fused ATPase/permease subunit
LPNVGQRSGRRSRSRDKATIKSQKAGIQRGGIAEPNARNADVIKAVGFGGATVAWFNQANEYHLDLHTGANDVTGRMGAVSKVLRMIMQPAVLGLGTYPTRPICR